jgi:rhodanese-related sulfurtransferase
MNKKYTIAAVLLIIGLFFLLGSKLNNQKTTRITNEEQAGSVQLVDSAQFSKLAKQKESFLLDVHIPEQTHIPGTDAFIAYNQIQQNSDKLPQDKSTPILVYCRSGSMSKSASREIANLGYTNVYDLEGGINAYREHNNQVAITPESRDLGTVVYGDVPTTTFTLTNFTPLPLSVTRVSTSCGCTSAEVEKDKLEAYDSTQIEVSFDPAVHGDDTDLGQLTRTIYIDTDNPNFPQVTSTITANVIKEDQ